MPRLLMLTVMTIALTACGTAVVFGQEGAPDAASDQPEGVLIYDSFESGTMKATNEDGFKWAENNRTSIVTSEKVVWNNGPKDVPMPKGRTWEAKTGDHALRFRYAAGQPWAEQRFDLGKAYPEVWVRYWLRVPDNFRHTRRSEVNKPTNHKLFAIWMDGYEVNGEGSTTTFQFWAGDNDVSSLTMYHYKNRVGGGNHSRVEDFIDANRDRGRWMQLIFHTKMNSAPDASDGFMRVYRRWEDQEAFEKVAESKDNDFQAPEGGPNGWTAGYLMGWANGEYTQSTEWLLDDFTVSTTSLLPDGQQEQ